MLHAYSLLRIRFRSEIAKFLVILTQATRGMDQDPYSIDAPPDKNKITPTDPFYKWKPVDWSEFRTYLTQIHLSMLRRDANASVNDIINGEGENREIDPSRSVSSFPSRSSSSTQASQLQEYRRSSSVVIYILNIIHTPFPLLHFSKPISPI